MKRTEDHITNWDLIIGASLLVTSAAVLIYFAWLATHWK